MRAKGETAEFLELLPEYKRYPFVTSKRMYLDTMQQVLSSSSKIIVDSKASNVLLLPLEQLVARTKVNSPNTKTEATTKPASDDLLTNSYMQQRSLERPGRSE